MKEGGRKQERFKKILVKNLKLKEEVRLRVEGRRKRPKKEWKKKCEMEEKRERNLGRMMYEEGT